MGSVSCCWASSQRCMSANGRARGRSSASGRCPQPDEWRALLPHLRNLRWAIHGGRSDRTSVLRSTARRAGPDVRGRPEPTRCRRFSLGAQAVRGEVYGQDPRRVDRDLRGHRCVRHTRAYLDRGRAERHLRARATVVEANGVEQAAPAPRFSRTSSGPVGTPPKRATPVDEIGW
jgi:hypothetical protein